MVHSIAAGFGQVYASHNNVLYKFNASLDKVDEEAHDLSSLALSEDGSYIAGIAAESKQVTVWKSTDLKTAVATHEFPKRPSSISISGSDMIVGDKFGDVFHRKLTESSTTTKETEPILGHVSMVLDVKFASPDFVITSDRDEHIRVSRFPKSYVIERFLLGHNSFVSHLLVSGTYLLSAGGDNYVLAWNWHTGEQLAKLDVPGNVIALAGSGLTAYIAMEGSSTVLKTTLPDLKAAEEIDVGSEVHALATLKDTCYAGLSDAVVTVGGSSKYAFPEADSLKTSEKHLQKRS